MELIGIVLNFLGVVVNFSLGTVGNSAFSLGFGILGTVFTILVVILLFYAIFKEKPLFVIPHLIYQVFGIVGLFVGALVTLIELASGKRVAYVDTGIYHHDSTSESFLVYAIIVIVILIICALIEIWCFFIVYKFYLYLKEKNLYYAPNVRYG